MSDPPFILIAGVYPGVIMTVLLRRKISYHLLQTYLPSGLFVIVAWLSLFLPPESIPGRITMAMTTLLTLAAMFGAVRSVQETNDNIQGWAKEWSLGLEIFCLV